MWKFSCIVLGVLILVATSYGQEADVTLDINTMINWADKFGDKLFNLAKKYSGLDFMKKEFDTKVQDDITVTEIDGLAMIQSMARGMQLMLQNKVHAVEKIVAVAESAHVDKYNKSVEADFSYYNAILINTNNSDADEEGPDMEEALRKPFHMEEDEHFNNIMVNTTVSTVQVPTNVYNQESDVLKGIMETESLDKVFIENYENDPTLTWQYFGSKTGFFRNYPGTKWVLNENDLDLYDCRKRGWYIRAATSPKDIIILIDASGSMTGLRTEIAKHTVRVIIDTLADDDFFNVLQFNTESKAIQDCFNDTLVQANSDNKNLIRGKLESVSPRGIADFDQALNVAFELLGNFSLTNMGASCSQAIMVITDGATKYPEEVFARYNANKEIRVFTYLIGREVTDMQVVKRMACENKGYFTQIATIADVEENAVKYIHVLSRPMVIAQKHNTVWTNVYMDTAGLQLMTTVSQPVFNKVAQQLFEGILLGVVGVDVPIIELLKLTAAYKLGVNGYPFAITNNGYLLFHPDLRPKYGPNGSCQKPNYNSVDLAEVELSDTDEMEYPRDSLELSQNQLRKAMVDRLSDSKKMTVWKYISSMKRIAKRNNTYYYTPLEATPFSLGIVLSGKYGHYKIEGMEVFNKPKGEDDFVGELCLITDGCEQLLNDTVGTLIVAKWKYCRLNNTEVKNNTREENVINYITDSVLNHGVLDKKCDAELINNLLFDANVTKPLIKHWVDLFNDEPRNDILLVFVGTKGGLTRAYMNPAMNQTEKSLSFLEDFPNTLEEEYYQRAAEVDEDSFVYSVPFTDETQNIDDPDDILVTASSALRVTRGGKTALAQVLGFQMRHSAMRDMLLNTSLYEKVRACRGASCRLHCGDDRIECVLVDNNGYIVIADDDNEIGTHFAEHDKNSRVFNYMLKLNIFAEKELIDYQGMCKKMEDQSAAASHILGPIFSITSFLTWWAEQLILFIFHLNFYHDWDHSMVGAQINQHECEMGKYEPCDERQKFFLADFDQLPKYNSTRCGNSDCRKSFSIHAIAHSNLILVVSTSDSYCPCAVFDPIDLEPARVVYNDTAWCDKLKRQRHRRRPDSCFRKDDAEDAQDCGRGSLLRPSTLLIAIVCCLYRLLTTNLASLRS